MINLQLAVKEEKPDVVITASGGVIREEEKPKKPKKTKKQISKEISEALTKFDDDRIQKLKDGFALGLNIKQACRYAEISTSTYHNHTKDNPRLLDEFDAWKQDLSIQAKTVRAKAIYDNHIDVAERYIAKEEPDVLKIEGADTIGIGAPEEEKVIISEFHAKLKESRLKRSQERAKADGEI